VKRLKVDGASPEALAHLERRFRAELQTLARFRHPRIVRLTHYAIEGAKPPLLVFELLEHGSLADHLCGPKGEAPARAPLSAAERVDAALGVAHGLAFLHGLVEEEEAAGAGGGGGGGQAVVHRDVKSANVGLSRAPPGGAGEYFAKILDCGLAKALRGGGGGGGGGGAGGASFTSGVLGTPGYMAPELADGDYTIQSEVYSFGVLLLELLCGARVGPRTASEVRKAVEDAVAKGGSPGGAVATRAEAGVWSPAAAGALCELVADCLQAREERRPAGLGEVLPRLRALRGAAAGGGGAPPPAPLLECPICLDDVPETALLRCKGPMAHVMCGGCVLQHVRASAGADSLRAHGGAVPCPGKGGCAGAGWKLEELEAWLDVPTALAFAAGLRYFGVDLPERKRAAEAELAAREAAAAALADRAEKVRRLRLLIAERDLTLRCPQCTAAFAEWTGCSALRCEDEPRSGKRGCGAAFCGLCLALCPGGDAHGHCQMAHGGYHHGEDVVKREHKARRVAAVAAALRAHAGDAALQRDILAELGKADLPGVGIAAAEVAAAAGMAAADMPPPPPPPPPPAGDDGVEYVNTEGYRVRFFIPQIFRGRLPMRQLFMRVTRHDGYDHTSDVARLLFREADGMLQAISSGGYSGQGVVPAAQRLLLLGAVAALAQRAVPAVALQGLPPPPGAAAWACDLCTYFNVGGAGACGACEAPRAAPPALPPDLTAAAAVGLMQRCASNPYDPVGMAAVCEWALAAGAARFPGEAAAGALPHLVVSLRHVRGGGGAAPRVARAGLATVRVLSSAVGGNDGRCAAAVGAGAPGALAALLRDFHGAHAPLAGEACKALGLLAVGSEPRKRLVREAGGVAAVVAALGAHAGEEEVVERAAGALIVVADADALGGLRNAGVAHLLGDALARLPAGSRAAQNVQSLLQRINDAPFVPVGGGGGAPPFAIEGLQRPREIQPPPNPFAALPDPFLRLPPPNPFAERRPPLVNDAGRAVLVAGGRYYCGVLGGRGGAPDPSAVYASGCQSCDGQCGPHNGCECIACHSLNMLEGRPPFAACPASVRLAAASREKKCPNDGVCAMPLCAWAHTFTPIAAIEALEENAIIDVQGFVRHVMELRHAPSRNRDVVISDASGCGVQIALWGGSAVLGAFTGARECIIGLHGVRVTNFGGRSLATTEDTRIVWRHLAADWVPEPATGGALARLAQAIPIKNAAFRNLTVRGPPSPAVVAGGGGAAADRGWACPFCTLVNPMETAACRACKHPTPRPPLAQFAPQQGQEVLLARTGEVQAEAARWEATKR
jgi:hypothetical protein